MMINILIQYLDELYPNAVCELEYTKDYELLLAIVMSAQTTDERVNEVNKRFKLKSQALCAYSLKFKFKNLNKLEYLKGKEIKIPFPDYFNRFFR